MDKYIYNKNIHIKFSAHNTILEYVVIVISTSQIFWTFFICTLLVSVSVLLSVDWKPMIIIKLVWNETLFIA